MQPKRTQKTERLAKLYDTEILPAWTERFSRLLLRDLVLPPKAMVLDVGCATADTALKLIRRMDAEGRIIAIESSSALLDVARSKAGALSGKRIFFRSEPLGPRLPFADDVYDLVVANLTLTEMDEPELAARELGRVAKPGGRVLVTLPLPGTFDEFYDLYREVLVKHELGAALEQLETWLAHKPSADTVRIWFERAELMDVSVVEERFTLLFRSSREFLHAPLVEYLWLAEWKALVGDAETARRVLRHIQEAIDLYLDGAPLALTVLAGCVRARKPTEEEAAELGEAPPLPPPPARGGDPDAAPWPDADADPGDS